MWLFTNITVLHTFLKTIQQQWKNDIKIYSIDVRS